jgi:hypothetical protein
VKLVAREAPFGTPVVLVNGRYSPSNYFTIPGTNSVTVTLQTSFTNGELYYTLDGTDPAFAEPRYSASITNIITTVTVRAFAYDLESGATHYADPVVIEMPSVFPLAASSPGGGSVSVHPPGGVQVSNASVTLTANASNGWTFVRWSGDVSATNNPLDLVVNRPLTNVLAIFGTPLFTTNIPATPVSFGTTLRQPEQTLYEFGQSVRLTAVPTNSTTPGKFFIQWGQAASGIFTNPLRWTVTSPTQTIRAIFSTLPNASTFTLTTLINGDGIVTRGVQQSSYTSGASVSLTAVPDAYSYFTGWSGDASGSSPSNTVLLTTNKTVMANFVPDVPRIVAQPRSQTAREGSSPHLSVVAQGASPLAYQWRRNGLDLAGETNFALFLFTVGASNAGNYSVQISNVIGVATSAMASLAVTPMPPDRKLVNWGWGPGVPTNAAGVVAVACGDSHGALVRDDGSVIPWGAGVPASMTNIVAVECGGGEGGFETLALRRDGTVVSSIDGVPPDLSNVVAVASGSYQRMALRRDGTVAAWGQSYGIPPANLRDVVAISSGTGGHNLALRNDGTVVAWGDNTSGRTNVPAGLSNVVAVAAGGYHSLALLDDGRLTGWGDNTHGQVPSGVSNITAIAAGLTHTLALRNDGVLIQWGNAPVPLGSLGTVFDFAGAEGKSVAMVASDLPPQIALTGPTNGDSFTLLASIMLQASATDGDGTVMNVQFLSGTNVFATVTNAPFHFIWTNAALGAHSLTAVATDNGGLSATSAPVGITVVDPLSAPLFQMGAVGYAVAENIAAGFITVTVLKSANSAAGGVRVVTRDGLATAITGGNGDYVGIDTNLTFAAGETSRTVRITINNDSLSEGNHEFEVVLASPTSGALLNPTNSVVTILDDDVPTTTDSVTNSCLPVLAPRHDGAIQVNLTPGGANGQWRLAWEPLWRSSGTMLGGLPTGNYAIEFKPVPNYRQPDPITVSLIADGIFRIVTTNYVGPFQIQSPGLLTVILVPEEVNQHPNPNQRAGWRLLGEPNFHASGESVTNLNPGGHVIEFRQITGWVAPGAREAVVFAGLESATTVNYLVGDLPQLTMVPVPFNQFETEAPYAYCGQLLTAAGYGSGTVVKERVVLTAAHVVFNDASLSYVDGARWFFQRQAGVYEPPSQEPRGWYVFGGYATQRTNDMSPGVSTLESRSRDVAALYFLETATSANLPGRGCYSGFLVSTPGQEWLTMTARHKLLTGYPLEAPGVAFPGRLYTSSQSPFTFQRDGGGSTDPVYYTTDIISAPGNSGGPLCVRFDDNRFYPAGVYLGGTTRSYVRAIDASVVDLINRAEVSANGGPNNTGGGVIRIGQSAGAQAGLCDGSLSITLEPRGAWEVGAAWRVKSSRLGTITSWTSNSLTQLPLNNGPFDLELRDAAGFLTPTNIDLSLPCAATNYALTFRYVQVLPRLEVIGNAHLALRGVTGTTYRLERSGRATTNGWAPYTNVAFGPTTTNLVISNALAPAPTNRFYRALRVP